MVLGLPCHYPATTPHWRDATPVNRMRLRRRRPANWAASCEICNNQLSSTSSEPRRFLTMSAFSEHKEELEHFQTMMGPQRGALAVTLDLLTNALVLVGQHGVYCHTNRDPNIPVMDIRIVQAEIGKAKELIQSVMENMRAERDGKGAA